MLWRLLMSSFEQCPVDNARSCKPMTRISQTLIAATLGWSMAFLLAACGQEDTSSPAQITAETGKEDLIRAPEALIQFLKKKSSYRLLAAADVRAHPEFAFEAGDKHAATSAAYLQNYLTKEFRPFELADTNRDGLKDIVAVLVEDRKFNVLVFQGKTQGFTEEPVWILRDEKMSLAGVRVAESGAIFPLYCLGCSNSGFVWTGDGYESDASAIKDEVCLIEKARLYSEASSASKVVHETTPLSVAIVVEIGPPEPRSEATPTQSKYRWYKVQLKKSPEKQGFVRDDAFDTQPGMCD